MVTSPPYWRSRLYGNHPDEIGQDDDPAVYIQTLVEVMQGVRTALADDGTVWLNLGLKYASGGQGVGKMASARANWTSSMTGQMAHRQPPPGYKRKDLMTLEHDVAKALVADGWYYRSEIVIDHCRAREPSRLDRPSQSHEYVFLLAKSANYYTRNPGEPWWYTTVWRIPAHVERDVERKHAAVMPAELARRCIMAGSEPGDTILDPFSGTGTTARTAHRCGRNGLGIELYAENITEAERRDAVEADLPLLGAIESEQIALPLA